MLPSERAPEDPDCAPLFQTRVGGETAMTTKPKQSMISYQREDRDIYAGLEFDPGNLAELWPDNMF